MRNSYVINISWISIIDFIAQILSMYLWRQHEHNFMCHKNAHPYTWSSSIQDLFYAWFLLFGHDFIISNKQSYTMINYNSFQKQKKIRLKLQIAND